MIDESSRLVPSTNTQLCSHSSYLLCQGRVTEREGGGRREGERDGGKERGREMEGGRERDGENDRWNGEKMTER